MAYYDAKVAGIVENDTELKALLERHNLNEQQQGEDAFSPWIGVNCEIHPNDEIFRFFYHHPTCKNPLRDYFADGWRTSYELMMVLEKVGQPLANCGSLLEFASGYGRLTRHFAKFPGAEKVHASDLMPGSVDFIKEKFGIDGFYSHSQPAQLHFPQQYDLVFVLSLFSHLPKSTWGDWLKKLYSAVAPGGCLVFTTHGESVADQNNVGLDGDGFFFVASSESSHLEGEEYGTSITSKTFVEQRVSEIDGAEIVLFEVDHFWAGQDVWILKKPNAVE